MTYKNNFEKNSNTKSLRVYGKDSVSKPIISIALPTYKRPTLLRSAINSALNQTYKGKYEVIVVDNENISNNKTDTEKLINQYSDEKVVYYKNTNNIGMVGNWNRCIELSKGEYITILHDDDWLDENYLEEALKRIDGEKAIFFKSEYHDERILINKRKNYIKEQILKFCHLITPIKYTVSLFDFFLGAMVAGTLGVLYNRNKLIELGGFDEDYYPIQDYHLHINYAINSGCNFWKIKLSNYRILLNESQNVVEMSSDLMYKKRTELIEKIRLPAWFLRNIQDILSKIELESNMKFWNLKEDSKNFSKKRNNIYRRFNIWIIKLLYRIRNLILYS